MPRHSSQPAPGQPGPGQAAAPPLRALPEGDWLARRPGNDWPSRDGRDDEWQDDGGLDGEWQSSAWRDDGWAAGPQDAGWAEAGASPREAGWADDPAETGAADWTGAADLTETVTTTHPAPATLAGDERWAMLAYLGVPFLSFLIPLAIYLTGKRRSDFVRWHAVQALNLSLTAILYTLSAVIITLMLALDTITAALSIMVPVTAILWLLSLGYLVRAAVAAGRGRHLVIPGWLCATIVHGRAGPDITP